MADEALQLASVQPSDADQLSRRAEAAAMAERNWATVSVARRAGGAAAIQLRRLDLAVARLRGAVEAAERAHDRQLAGQAHMTLASALALRGQTGPAFAAIERSLAEVTGSMAARALFQRAAILQELGRVDEALNDLRSALPALRRAGDTAFEARALSNRSLMYINRRQFAAAEADLVRSRDLVSALGQTLSAAYVEQNLGSLYAHRGDVAIALRHFDRAGEHYQNLDLEVGSLRIDQAKLLLSVRLVAEARQAAQEAVRIFTVQHRRIHLPEAQLMLSTVALIQNDTETAASAARAARAAFVRAGRREWRVLAHYAELQAEFAAALKGDETFLSPATAVSLPRPLRARLSASAIELSAAGWAEPALEAHILAGTIAMAQGKSAIARDELSQAARARHAGPADVRARAWLAEALLRERAGARRGARSALRAGIRAVEDYRATVGATELRAHVSVHRGALARAGVRLAIEDADPRAVHAWSERGRASAYLPRPVKPPDDPELAHHLADLRATVSDIEEARTRGDATQRLVARQTQLEQAIRAHTRRSADPVATQAATPPTIAALSDQLRNAALVEFVENEGTLHAVAIVEGRAHLRQLGPTQPSRKWVEQVTFALHRLARRNQTPAQTEAAETVLARGGEHLDQTLFAPLRSMIGDRALVLIPSSRLQSVPWSVIPFCRGRPVSVAPSAGIWLASAQRGESADDVVTIAGPGLSGAVTEAVAVAALYTGATVLTGSEASSGNVGAALSRARVAHVAAHGVVRADNPLFSAIVLADGPFNVYDLEGLGRTPRHVVLAACSTASHTTAGTEVLGFAAALLSLGTATLIAPVVPIDDSETIDLMTTYHRHLRADASPAAALAATQQQHRDQPRARASAAGFVCIGA